MNRRRQLRSVALMSVIFAVLLTIGCDISEDGKVKETPMATTNARTIGSAGSTFVAPLIEHWAHVYEQTHAVHVNYRPIGSGAGIEEMKKGLLEFGASDAPLTDDQIREIGPTIQVPISAGPVCVVYNLPSLHSPIQLSAKTLAGIYLGTVISWQDTAIAKDNPGVQLPHLAIIVVHRSDGSGTTNIFTGYLNRISGGWSAGPGVGLSVAWPVGLGAEGSKGVAETVKGAPGTIGYLELNYAKQSGVSVASIQNAAGEFVLPTPASTTKAITAFDEALANDVRTPIVDPPASAKGAYPIVGVTFVLVRRDGNDVEDRQAVKDFIAYALSQGQDSAEGLSYARLPQSVQAQGQQLLSQLKADGQPLR